MALNILPTKINQPTRDKIIELLAIEWPLLTKNIQFILKQNYSTNITYQAVHKLLNQLLEEKVVMRKENGWMLNEKWVEEQSLFFKKIDSDYKRGQSPLGKTLKVFAFDVNGVLTPEMTHVEFAKKSIHYPEIKRIIANQTMGKIPMTEAFLKLTKLVKGISLFETLEYSENFTLMSGVQELLKKLKDHDVKTGIITTGFMPVMERFNQRLGKVFDFIICNRLIFANANNQELSEKEVEEAIKRNNPEELKKLKIKNIEIVIEKQETKTQLLLKYLKENGLEFKNVCCVGDSMGDADFIKVAAEEGGVGIAFNPNLSLLEYARYLKNEGKNIKIVESQDLRDIYALFR